MANRRLPRVIAHRGSGAEFAEHTLAGYRRAIEEGADALECDVRLTADGHVVCVHDRRIDRTSTGKGVVSSMTLDQLQEHDFGSWWTSDGVAEAPEIDEERHRVLTLDRLLRLVGQAPRPVGLAIETKHPSRYAGYLEKRVVETLHAHGLDRVAPGRAGALDVGRVQVMSFSELAMRRLQVLAPRLPRVLLMEKVPLRFRSGLLPYHARIAGPSMEIVRRHPAYVARLHSRGHEVHVWTVDRLDDLDYCVELGVDAVVTNRPASIVKRLQKYA